MGDSAFRWEALATSNLKEGGRVGPWTLRWFLGGGGNAEVWEAKRSSEVVALKVLRKRDVTSEPFARFCIESDFLQRVRPSGVVPILDSYLPVTLSRGERAWIAMPVATPIAEALGPEPDVEAVCRALMEIAYARHFVLHDRMFSSALGPSALASVSRFRLCRSGISRSSPDAPTARSQRRQFN
jgi:hypothetical protein